MDSILSFIEHINISYILTVINLNWISNNYCRIAIVERHSAAVTDVLRFVGLTHGGID